MAVYSVDTEAVMSANIAARGTVDRLQAESSTLLAQLGQLQASWTGSASAAFQACSEQWRGAQQHVEQVLASISVALGQTATQYADADMASANMFR